MIKWCWLLVSCSVLSSFNALPVTNDSFLSRVARSTVNVLEEESKILSTEHSAGESEEHYAVPEQHRVKDDEQHCMSETARGPEGDCSKLSGHSGDAKNNSFLSKEEMVEILKELLRLTGLSEQHHLSEKKDSSDWILCINLGKKKSGDATKHTESSKTNEPEQSESGDNTKGSDGYTEEHSTNTGGDKATEVGHSSGGGSNSSNGSESQAEGVTVTQSWSSSSNEEKGSESHEPETSKDKEETSIIPTGSSSVETSFSDVQPPHGTESSGQEISSSSGSYNDKLGTDAEHQQNNESKNIHDEGLMDKAVHGSNTESEIHTVDSSGESNEDTTTSAHGDKESTKTDDESTLHQSSKQLQGSSGETTAYSSSSSSQLTVVEATSNEKDAVDPSSSHEVTSSHSSTDAHVGNEPTKAEEGSSLVEPEVTHQSSEPAKGSSDGTSGNTSSSERKILEEKSSEKDTNQAYSSHEDTVTKEDSGKEPTIAGEGSTLIQSEEIHPPSKLSQGPSDETQAYVDSASSQSTIPHQEPSKIAEKKRTGESKDENADPAVARSLPDEYIELPKFDTRRPSGVQGNTPSYEPSDDPPRRIETTIQTEKVDIESVGGQGSQGGISGNIFPVSSSSYCKVEPGNNGSGVVKSIRFIYPQYLQYLHAPVPLPNCITINVRGCYPQVTKIIDKNVIFSPSNEKTLEH